MRELTPEQSAAAALLAIEAFPPDLKFQELQRLLDFAPHCFADPDCGQIALAVARLRHGGHAVSPAAAAETLRESRPAAAALALELEGQASLGKAIKDADGIWRDYLSRQATDALAEAVQEVAADPGAIEKVLTYLPATLTSIRNGNLPSPNSPDALPDIIDAAEFLAEPLAEPPVLVEGILHQGGKLVFGGSSKSYKTWSLLDLAVSVATGKDWLRFPTSKAKVLFVNFEIQPHAWQRRIAAVCSAKGIKLEAGLLQVWNLRGRAADFRKLVPKIIQRTRRESFGLVILDPIYKLYGNTDENSAGEVASLLNSLETLATETGAAVAFGAHFAKGNASGKEAIDRISGSGVFARDPDSILVFTKHEADDAFVVEPILRNFAPIPAFATRWQFPLMARADDLDPAKLKQAGGRKPDHAPCDLLELLPPEGLSNKDWIERAKQNGISNRTYFRLRKELQKTEKVFGDTVNGTWKRIITKRA